MLSRESDMKYLITFLVLALVLAVFGLGFEDWRGKSDWEKCKAGLEAKGEHLDIDSFVPPSVPDDKNFALTPLMKPVHDYIKDPKTGNWVARDPNPPISEISNKVAGTTLDYPSVKGWQTGNARSLEVFQAYYRKSLPGLNLTKSPAEDLITVFRRYDAMFA